MHVISIIFSFKIDYFQEGFFYKSYNDSTPLNTMNLLVNVPPQTTVQFYVQLLRFLEQSFLGFYFLEEPQSCNFFNLTRSKSKVKLVPLFTGKLVFFEMCLYCLQSSVCMSMCFLNGAS